VWLAFPSKLDLELLIYEFDMLTMNLGQKQTRWQRFCASCLGLLLCCAGLLAFTAATAMGADLPPEVMVKTLSDQLLELVSNDKSIKTGDVQKIAALVDSQVMPHLNFQRMTASAVGPAWRQATPEQQAKLQDEFQLLLVRTYARALNQVNDLTITIKPMRNSPQDTEVLVRSEVKGHGDPVQIDYRLEKTPSVGLGWKIYNLNVMGVWLVDTYRTQFAQEINAHGVDGLIATLAQRNQNNAKPKP
jgi:phospholipid transport system substrate-binding protein